MDIHELRSWATLAMIITFSLIVIWAYSGRRRKRFDEASRLPFEEPDAPGADVKSNRGEQ